MPASRAALLLLPMLLLAFDPVFAAAHHAKPKQSKPVAVPAVSAECADFYASANADWLKAHPAGGGDASVFADLIANARAQQQALLNEFARAPSDDAQRALALLWADGMNEPTIEAAGTAPLRPLFDRIGKAKKSRDVPALIADLHAAGIPVLFNFAADADRADPGLQIGAFTPGGLGLPDPDYYTRADADTRALLGRYRAYVETILRLSGTPAERISTESGWVLGIEMRLAQAWPTLAQTRDPVGDGHDITPRELSRAYPHLAFDRFLRAQRVTGDRFSLAQDGFFRGLDDLLADTPVEQWQAYLRFHVASALSPYLSRGFQDAHYDLYEHLLAGEPQPAPREQVVLGAIDRALGDVMGDAYTERYLPPATKDAANRVAEGVRAALQRAIASSAWMDDATRATALAKLGKLRFVIGAAAPAPKLSGLALGAGYAADLLAIAAWRHQLDMAAIGQRESDPGWAALAQTPFIGYDLIGNRLIITAAFLQAPLFDPSAPLARQYGALGALIGHQLHYAIDGKGRGVDAGGQFRDWWTPSAEAAFAQRIAPLVAQYDAYPAAAAGKVDGGRTRDENIADLAGVELAYAAFQAADPHPLSVVAPPAPTPAKTSRGRHAKKHASPAPAVPVMAPPIDAGFFAAYANLWARGDAPADDAEVTALQAPAKYRVDGPLANLPAFGKTYACLPGQPMMRAAPVSIWR